MRCLGRNTNFSRCKNQSPFFLCNKHKKQGLIFILITIPSTIVTYVSINDSLSKTQQSAAQIEHERKAYEEVISLNNFILNSEYQVDALFRDTNSVKMNCIPKKISYCEDNPFLHVFVIAKLTDLSDRIEARDYYSGCDFEFGSLEIIDSINVNNEIHKVSELRYKSTVYDVQLNHPLFSRRNPLIEKFAIASHSAYMPKEIKHQLQFFDSLIYHGGSIAYHFKNEDCIFLMYPIISKQRDSLLNHPDRIHDHTDLVYKIEYYNREPIMLDDFYSRIRQIKEAIDKWLIEKKVYDE